MIEFTFYSTKSKDYDANDKGCQVATYEIENPEDGTGNELAVIKATELAALPPGIYVAVQTRSDSANDVIGWGWLIEVNEPTPQVKVLQ